MKKFLKWFFISLAILFVLLLSIPFLFKGKIVELVKTETNKKLNAVVAFDDDVSIGILKSFPDLNVSIKKISVANKGDFEGDTLFAAKELYITLDIMKIISGDMSIKKIIIDEARIHGIALKDGKANWQITKPTPEAPIDTTPSKFKMSLQKLELKNSHIEYDDKALGFYTLNDGTNLELNGDFTADVFDIHTKTDIASLTVAYGGVSWLASVKTFADANIKMEMKDFKFTFKKNIIKLNDLEASVDGTFAMLGNDKVMDMDIKTQKTDFRSLLSLVPVIYKNNFSTVKTSGNMTLAAKIKGTMNEKLMPAFDVKLGVDNGYFAYPSMPSDMKNIFIKLHISNPDGVPDNTFINLEKMHADIGKNPLDASLTVRTPVSDADIDAKIKGKIFLDDITRIVPQPKGTELSGTVNADIEAKGKMSAVQKKQFDKFYTAGKIEAEKLHYKSETMKQGIDINTMKMNFTPQYVALDEFTSTLAGSDISMKGKLENFLAYIFKNETLTGQLSLTSNYFNCNNFLSSDPKVVGENTQPQAKKSAPEAKDSVPLTAFSLPENINFSLNGNFGKILYDNLLLTDAKAKLKLEKGTLTIEDLSSGLFNGRLAMGGTYEAHNPAKPTMNCKLNLQNMDIAQISKYCSTIKKFTPVADYISGNFSSTFSLNGNLNSHMKPVLSSLSSFGTLDVPQMKIAGFKPLDNIADALTMQQYKQLILQKIKMMFEIKNGRIYLKPFDFNIDKNKATCSGSNGIDQTMDYKININVPRSQLGDVNTTLNNLLQQAASQNIKITLPDPIPVLISVGGTVTSPKIKTDLNEVKNKLIADAKSQLTNFVSGKKKELEDKAKQETDKLKKQAEDKAKAEADRLKKQAEEEAKKKGGDLLKGIFKK